MITSALSAGVFDHYSSDVSKLIPDARTAPFQGNVGGACAAGGTYKNHSVIVGGEVVQSVTIDRPPAYAQDFCCGIFRSPLYFTNTDLGPSSRYKDENTYVCTGYAQKDPNVPITFAPGNSSVSAGQAPMPVPPDPKCTEKETLSECLVRPTASCVWSGGRCEYEPPVDCGGFLPAPAKRGPFCIGTVLAEGPYPSGAPGRKLNSFNWTAGSISGNVDPVAMPPQVLQLGQTGWFSTQVDPGGWKICVYYNELTSDGKSSDPDSGFVACAAEAGGLIDLTRGSTSKLDTFAVYSQSTGWNASGHFPAKTGNLYASVVIWSNSTA